MDKDIIAEKIYKTTKEQCQALIDKVPVVCPGCGGQLQPVETVDNSGDPTYWAGCLEPNCQSFSCGVSPEIFWIADKMVRERNCQPYPHHQFPYNGTDTEKDYYYASQIRGACNIVTSVLSLQLLRQQTENE